MKALTKEQEIELLKKLVEGNGYFSQLFGEEDFVKMRRNIYDDFPIEMETYVDKEICRLKEQAENAVKSSKDAIQIINSKRDDEEIQFCSKLLRLSDKNVDELVRERIGWKKTIKLKKQLEIQISEVEVDYLISVL
jgi:hypothetical protein